MLWKTYCWDMRLLWRYGLIPVALIIALLYVLIMLNLPESGYEQVVAFFILSDPTMIGFIFIGVMILFEKDANTIQALVVSPLPAHLYLISKIAAFTTIGLIAGLMMAVISQADFNYLFIILAILLTSVIFTSIGFVGVARVKTFNQYIIVIPVFLAPLCLPFLGYWQILDSWFFYVIPTQACIILFQASYETVPLWQLYYAIIYSIICIAFLYKLCIYSFIKNFING